MKNQLPEKAIQRLFLSQKTQIIICLLFYAHKLWGLFLEKFMIAAMIFILPLTLCKRSHQ